MLFNLKSSYSQAKKDSEALKIKAKCTEFFDQSFTHLSRIGILNNCNGFRLGWETTLLPPEDRMIAVPDEYDALNELVVGNYIQRHYIEKEGIRIEFLSEDEEEGLEAEGIEEYIA